MKSLCSTIFCGVLALPGVAAAEFTTGAQLVLGYGEVDGEGEGYGILDFNMGNKHDLGAVKLSWDVRLRARTDQDEIGDVENNNIDGAIEFEFGGGGKLGFTTFIETYDQKPWADGDLFNRGSVGVFPVIQKQYDGVRDSQFTAGGPFGKKVDPDLLLTYSNDIGRVGFELTANVLGTWDGYTRSEMANEGENFALAEAKFTLPTKGYGIYSLKVNDIGDAEMQVVYPIRKIGLTLIGRYSINEGNFDQYRGNLGAIYRHKGGGLFKGAFLAHAFNDTASRSTLGLTFGQDNWEMKFAGDTDGDYALEGSYSFSDTTSLLVGWDSGFENDGGPGNGFDDAAFPAPVFAAGRDSAFEIALVQKF